MRGRCRGAAVRWAIAASTARAGRVVTAMNDTAGHALTVRDHWWWRPGWRIGRRFYTFHVIFDADEVWGADELRLLMSEYRQSLAGMAGLDLIPDEWLHLTVQGVGFTDEVGAADIDAILGAASVDRKSTRLNSSHRL